MSNTSQDLNNSLWSTLKAWIDEMSRSFGGIFGTKKGSQDKTNLKPNQITPADVAYEEEMMKQREVKILV